ncbi:MAG: hypothetical protein AAGC47_07985 [Bacteroidota bacterium]
MKGIALKSSHIYLSGEIANYVFGNVIHAYVNYAEDQDRLLITPVSSAWFTKMYEPNQLMLKERNLRGDKTLAIHEILIDHEIDPADRELEYEVVERTQLIKVKMK